MNSHSVWFNTKYFGQVHEVAMNNLLASFVHCLICTVVKSLAFIVNNVEGSVLHCESTNSLNLILSP